MWEKSFSPASHSAPCAVAGVRLCVDLFPGSLSCHMDLFSVLSQYHTVLMPPVENDRTCFLADSSREHVRTLLFTSFWLLTWWGSGHTTTTRSLAD